MKFNQEFFPLEAEFSNLGPREGVNLGVVLEHKNTHMRYRQV